ncbi:MAG: hypothetical protein L0387_05685 [Acidobacteria bacterium]|nr:hypothetical protein [Acidobacteriota bacterium]
MSIVIGVRQLAQFVRNFDAQFLNPQPLPPREQAGYKRFGNLDSRLLNPQPLPPKAQEALYAHSLDLIGPRALNPQPLPPKDLGALYPHFLDFISSRALNPQPLLPKPQPDPPPFIQNLALASRSLVIR